MKLLTKDNLENMIDAGCIDEADRDEILKWKEDSEQWKIYLDGGMNNLFEIHERLTKEIVSMSVSSHDYHAYEVEEILEKVLKLPIPKGEEPPTPQPRKMNSDQAMKIMEDAQIVERLKKRIPELRDEDDYVKSDSFWSYDAVADELEKILGGEK